MLIQYAHSDNTIFNVKAVTLVHSISIFRQMAIQFRSKVMRKSPVKAFYKYNSRPNKTTTYLQLCVSSVSYENGRVARSKVMLKSPVEAFCKYNSRPKKTTTYLQLCVFLKMVAYGSLKKLVLLLLHVESYKSRLLRWIWIYIVSKLLSYRIKQGLWKWAHVLSCIFVVK